MPTKKIWDAFRDMRESELRLQVIIPLLRATKGVSGVTDVHGQNERGLDVIFFVESAIERTCYGLQLKAGPISGGGTGDRTVKQIVDQLELADGYEHPIATKNGGTYRIDRFIVATNGPISGTARDEIARRLRRIPVQFWDADEIIRRLHESLPQFFQLSDVTAADYLQALISKHDVLDAVDQIPGVAKRTLTQVFVEPNIRRKFDPDIASDTGSSRTLSQSRPALGTLDAERRVVLLADQDGGKSTIFKMLSLKRARAILAGTATKGNDRFPVIIRAREALGSGLTIIEAIASQLRDWQAHGLANTLHDNLLEGRYTICIDGFSEFSAGEDKDLLAGRIEEFATDYPDVAIIVAARPVDFLHARYLTGFRQYVIEDFSESQVAALIRGWAGQVPTVADVAKKMVERLREALQLPGSPIPAMIGVMLHEEQGRYITNTAEAIDRYMVIRLGRYAHELGMKQEVDWARKQDLLAEVAFGMVEKDVEALRIDEFIETVDDIFVRQGETARGATVLSELTDSGVLALDGDLVSFFRSSFRDFFAGHHVYQRGDLDRFGIENIYDRRWGGTLVFAAGLRRRNSELLTSMSAAAGRRRAQAIDAPDEDYFYAAHLCGRVLSNSDSTDRGPRVQALRTCLVATGDTLGPIEEIAIQQFGNIGRVLAVLAAEHTFFVTIGVPWLRKQLLELLESTEFSEEERYVLASTYAHLGFEDCFRQLESVTRGIKSTRVLLVMNILLEQFDTRELGPEEKEALQRVRGMLRHKLAGRSAAVRDLLELRSTALEVERKRMQRLIAKKEKKT